MEQSLWLDKVQSGFDVLLNNNILYCGADTGMDAAKMDLLAALLYVHMKGKKPYTSFYLFS